MKKSEEKKKRILVLDCDHKNALAIVRHLGKTRQYTIDAVSYSKASVAFFSKFVNQKYIIHDPKKEPGKYVDDLLNLMEQNAYLLVLPVSYISYQLCSANKNRILEKTHLTIAKVEQINLASGKAETYQLAEKIGIPYPKTIIVNSITELEHVETTYPCVIKAPFEAGKNIVRYARNKEELVRLYKKVCSKNNFKSALPVIQQYIKGEGAGFFAFYKNGECKNYFMHRRIREYPVSGGASTCAESFYDEGILNNGKKILDYLRWEGIAMVEFKKDNSTGIYNLMEINAKFWGSLDLALVSGVNFPQMLIGDALGLEIEKCEFEAKRTRFQWILNGDLFHVIERPRHLFDSLKDLFIAKNDFSFSDIKPNLFQLLYTPVHYYKKLFK